MSAAARQPGDPVPVSVHTDRGRWWDLPAWGHKCQMHPERAAAGYLHIPVADGVHASVDLCAECRDQVLGVNR